VFDDAGLDVASASVARPTLDDVYLRHTGRSFAAGGRFLEFLTPGVIMMTALFASVWAGTPTSRTWNAASWTGCSRRR